MNDNLFLNGMGFSIVMTVLLALAACAQQADKKPARPEEGVVTTPEPASAPPVAAPVPADKTAARQSYSINAASSDIRIFVYRKGNLSRLGHDHVISAGAISGRILLADNIGESELDLSIPVTSLVVDDPEVRQQAGLESGSQPSEKDMASTRHAMLSPKVLDAERFGSVKVHAQVVGGTLAELELNVTMTIHGVKQQFRSPVTVEKTPQQITASGSFQILQSDFGITPFSVLAGALALKDEVKIQYRIVAAIKTQQ
ncbi:MAG: YceI family protein [Pseudomonadota bacterium]|nr:YceI family protein [Pseudomonadota bacterium]